MSIEALDIRAGEFTFDALASGPPDGRLVLLLHGFPQVATMWRRQLVALGEAGYRAVAPNQRGYASGARPAEVADYHLDHLVADVLAMADSLGVDRFDLVGHDWGAIVGWHLAHRHRERLRSYTAVSVPHMAAVQQALNSGESDQKQRSSYIDVFRAEGHVAERILLEDDAGRLRNILRFPGADEAAVDETVKAMQEPGRLTGALNWYRAMERPRFDGSPDVFVPTLFIGSTNDLAVSLEAIERCGDFVKAEFRSEVLDGVSHWVPDEEPETVTRLLLEHLAAN